MTQKLYSRFKRRDFFKYSLLTAGAAGLPASFGCSKKSNLLPDLDQSKPVILKNGTLVDVTTGTVTENTTLVIRQGIIESVISGDIPGTAGAAVIDLEKRFVVPGLIDAHCHSTASPVFSMSTFDLFRHMKQQKKNYSNTIESGITTIRDMGSFPGLLQWFIGDINSGDLPGPRVVYCNSMLNIKGGHPEIPPSDVNFFAEPASWFIGMMMNNFRDMEELKEALHENAKGASFIKLTVDNKSIFCRKGTIPVYSDDHLKEIFRFADKTGLPVVCHHHYLYGFRRAMKYPVHSVEHVVSDAFLSDNDITAMVKQKVAIVPTLTVGQSFLMEEAFDTIPSNLLSDRVSVELEHRREYLTSEAHLHCDPKLHKSNLDMLANYKKYGRDTLWDKKIFLVKPELYFGMINYGSENLLRMKDAGVLIGCGIDAGMPLCYFGGMYREFELLSRLGFSNLEILQCATINNAKILKIDDKAGTIEAGKWADIVIYEANPLNDIRVLRKPSQVFKEGVLMVSDRPVALNRQDVAIASDS